MICVSLNPRVESNNEEETESWGGTWVVVKSMQVDATGRRVPVGVSGPGFRVSGFEFRV